MRGLNVPEWASRFADASQRFLVDAGLPDADVSVLLVDDAQIRELNRAWRQIDTPTDVLSWPHMVLVPGEIVDVPEFLGDIAISVETTARQASAREWNDGDEAALLLLHGILHLLGHEDDSESGAAKMRAIEAKYVGQPLDELPKTVQTASKV